MSHMHVKLLMASSHVPCIHGELAHSSISENWPLNFFDCINYKHGVPMYGN